MNRSYRVIYNRALGVMQAVSEHGRARGKSGGVKTQNRQTLATCTLLATYALGLSLAAPALSQSVISVNSGETHTIPGNYQSGPFNGGTVYARGTLQNQDMLHNLGYLSNFGSISNQGVLHNDTIAHLYNGAGSTINNLGLLKNDGFLHNHGLLTGLIHNRGTINVIGSAATWEVGSILTTGGSSGESAVLTIKNGGKVESWHGQIASNSTATGTVTVEGQNSQWINPYDINVGIRGTGTLNIRDGGLVQNNGNGKIGHYTDSTGTVTVEGPGSQWENGTFLRVGDEGTGTLTISNDGLVAVGTKTAELGVVELGRVVSGIGAINIGAGTGVAPAAAGRLSAPSVEFGHGTGTLNFNHNSATTFTASLTSTGAGTHAVNHSAGTTLLTGDSSGFSGRTTVSGGTLLVGDRNGNGKLGGAITVSSGGILGGSGAVGSTKVSDGGRIAPGNSIGALKINGDLTLSTGAILDYELGGPAATDPSSGVSDRIDVTHNLELNGTLNLAQSGNPTDGTAGLGYYRLMTYGGTLSVNGLMIGNTPAFATPTNLDILTSDGKVDLLVTTGGNNDLQHWQGGDGTWGAAHQLWLNQNDTSPTTWAGNHAVFKDANGHTGGIVSVADIQNFKGLQFVDHGYQLDGAGELQTHANNSEIRVLGDEAKINTKITGTGGIIKTQAGTLTLSGNNTYEGGTYLMDGTVSVSSDANLGASNGALTFDGGALQITGDTFTNMRRQLNWKDHGGSFDIADPEHLFTINSDITGQGDFIKRGEGDLRLTGNNSYGNTLIEAGDLIGDARSISGDVHTFTDGTLIFDQADDAQFAGHFSGADSQHASVIKSGPGTLSLLGSSSLNWFIENGEVVSSADRFSGYIATDTDGVFTFDQYHDTDFGNQIKGRGHLNKKGDGELRLSGDSSAFEGTTTIASGTLSVGGPSGNGKLGGALSVASGGTLAGNGTVGKITVHAGGTIAPGNSVGTLTVNGDLTLKAGSRYNVEVNPEGTEADLIKVTGGATLEGGSVMHIGIDGPYKPLASYRILSAGTGLTGAFDEVSSDFAFLTPSLSYDYDNYAVDLTLKRNGNSFASQSHTRNQFNTAQGLESLPVTSELYQQILSLPNGAPAITFDTLSGEIHASTLSALYASSDSARTLPLSYLRRNLSVGLKPGALLAQAGNTTLPAAARPQSAALPLWAEVLGNWQHTNSDGNAAALKQSTSGVFIGGDHRVGGGWRVGAALGYSDSRLRVNDRNSKTNVDTYSATLYAGKAIDAGAGKLNLLAGAAYSRHEIKSTRNVALADWNHTLKASYHASTSQLFGELGYALPMGQYTIEPFAGISFNKVRAGSFSESGGATALSGHSANQDITTSTLGLRASTNVQWGVAQGSVYGVVAWRHAFGDATPDRTLQFNASQPFTVTGVPIASNTALLQVGADIAVSSKARIGVSYDAQVGGGNRAHTGKLNVQWNF